MSLWIGNQEVGLAPYQSAGQVGGDYIVRPEGSDTSKAYIPGVGSTSIMIEGGAIAGKGGEGVGVTTTVRRDQYGNVIGIKQIGSSGETIFERKPTVGGGYVEVGTPVGVQSRYAEIERTKAEMPLYRARAEYRAKKEAAKQIEDAAQSLINQGYKPYVTIEGTTLYSKTPPKKDVTIPRFGKMVQRGERTEPFLDVFTPDKFIDQVDNTQRNISLQIEKLDREISKKYGLPETVGKAVKTYRHAQFLAEYEPKYKKLGGGQSELGKAGSEFAIGFVEEAAQKPITATGNALFALLVTKGVGGVAAKVPILTKGVGTGKITSKVNAVNILGTSLATMYGIDVTQRAIAAPDKARFAGQITATEILPFAAGGYIGTRKLPSIPTKAIARRTEISYLKAVREGRILQAKTTRDFETFINDESAELAKRRRKAQQLIQIQKPEVAKKAETVEVIRADIALERQMKAEARINQMSISNPKTRHEFRQLSKTMQSPVTKQIPMIVSLNIQKAEAILKPEVIAISVQKYKPVQEAKAIQEARTIQEATTVQIAEAILKAKTEQSNIQKAKELLKQKLKQKSKIELPIKKIIPPKTAKNFIKEVDERYKRKKKSKWIWDVNNPVPTLEEIL